MAQESSFTFANFSIDLPTHQLLRDGDPVPLGVKGFDTLVVLVQQHHRVVGKDELIKLVWPDSFVSEDSLTHTISAVRRALGDDPTQPRFIATIARRGYRFIAPVTRQSAADETLSVIPGPPPGRSVAASPTSPSRGGAPRIVWALLGGLAAIVITSAMQRMISAPSGAEPTRALRFTQELPRGTTLASGGVLSPDGAYLAFVARDDRSGRTQLWVRSLDSAEVRPLEGTDGARRPFWAPDGLSLGFFAGSRLMRVALTGEAPQSVTPTIGALPTGGTWNADGLVLYADSGPIRGVNASGGAAREIIKPDRSAQEMELGSPQFLPDGRHFLYTVSSADPDRSGTWVASLDTSEKARLLDSSNTAVTYAPEGYLLYARDGVLMAQSFDASTRRLAGEPRAVSGSIPANSVLSASHGLLAFGGGTTAENLVWFDEGGKTLGSQPATVTLNNVALSPTGDQLVGTSTDPTRSGVWMVDLDRDVPTRLIPDGTGPVWSPDGRQLAFVASRSPGMRAIYTRSLTGETADTMLHSSSERLFLQDWSSDGRYLVFSIDTSRTKNDLWVLPLDGDRVPRSYLDSPAREIQAQVSPDGRWMAYVSDETGMPEVYLQAFPMPGNKRTISIAGGAQPQWREDGRQLYYLSLDNTVMAVDITADEGLNVGRPRPLFRPALLGSLTDYRNLYSVTADGHRFLMKSIAAEAYQEPITILVHWPLMTER